MADANFTIGADAKAFTETLQKMGKDMDTLANSGTAKLARLGQAFNALSMVGGALKSVSGGIVDAAAAVIKPAAAAERLNLSFEVLMGSEGEMLKFMERLNAYAAETPFALDEISEAAKLMFANTGQNADQVMESIRRIGNISAMSGKSMVELTRVFAKAFNSGVTNEVAESFEIMGVAVRKELADMLGVSFNQVKKLISEGKISFQELETALRLITERGGKYAGGTDRLSQSLEGLGSTLEDNVNMALRTFGEQLLPAVKPLVETLISAVDTAIPSIELLGATFGEWLGDKVQDNLIPNIDALIERIPEMGIQLETAAIKAGEFIDKLIGMTSGIVEIGQAIKDAFGGKSGTGAGFNFMGGFEIYDEQLFLESLQAATQGDKHAQREQQRKAELEAAKKDAEARVKARKLRKQQEAIDRDEKRRADRLADEEWRASERERQRKETEARWEREQAARDAEAQKKENERARKNYQDRRRNYELARQQREYDKLSIPEQRRELTRRGRDLGVEGQISPESIRARLDALASSGAKSNEQEIAALERLLEAWDKLADRKREYGKARGETAAQMRIDALEAAGQRRAAALLREKLTVAQRVEELQNQGATRRAAMERAAAESKIRQLAAVTQALQNSRVEFIQGHQAAEGGGGVSLRVANNTLELSRKRNTLLQEVKNITERISKNLTTSSSNTAVLA